MDESAKAKEIYLANFENKAWYGRCIFLSWYCDLGTCKFCFRSTIKHKIKHKESARRSVGSVLIEALLCRKLNWPIEFLTGGYGIFPFDEIVQICKNVSAVYGEKIWVNLGALKKEELEKLSPYIQGVVASIETPNPTLHSQICPDKKMQPYFDMFLHADLLGLKKSMTIVIGLGEQKEDIKFLFDIISKYKLDRLTFYALKPVYGTPFTKGPQTKDYLWWIEQTRIQFPKLEIICGTTARRYEEVGMLMDAGANAFTKFPATKLFGTDKAKAVSSLVWQSGRQFISELVSLPAIDWNKEIDALDISDKLKSEMKIKIIAYLEKMGKEAVAGDE